MMSIMPGRIAVAVVLLMIATLVASGLSFGVIQTLLAVLFCASAAMFVAFIAVASSREGH